MDKIKINPVHAVTAAALMLLSSEFTLFAVRSQNISTAELGLLLLISLFFVRPAGSADFVSKNSSLVSAAGVFLAAVTLSAVFSPVPGGYAFKWAARYSLMFLAALALASKAFKDPSLAGFIHLCLFWLGSLFAAIAVAEAFSPGFAGFLSSVFRGGESVYIGDRLRPAATLTHANIFSCFMNVAIASGLLLKRDSVIGKKTFWPLAALMIIASIMSSSRNAMLSFAVMSVILMLNRQTLKTAAMLLFIFIVSYPVFSPSLGRIGEIRTQSSVNRIMLWKSAVKMFSQYPATGVGPGCYNKMLKDFAPPELAASEKMYIEAGALNAHNGFFSLLAETGVAGTVAAALLAVLLLSGIASRFTVLPAHPVYGLLAALVMPFAADAFYYSYFFFTILLSVFFMSASKEAGNA